MSRCRSFVIVFLVVLILGIGPVHAAIFDNPLTPRTEKVFLSLDKNVKQHPLLKGKFTQTRKVQGLSKKFVTSGDFMFVQKKGVYWHITAPFIVTYVFTDTGTLQILDGERRVIDVNERPYYQQISNMIKTLKAGDLRQLKEFFEVFFTGDRTKWQVGLASKDASMRRAVDDMVILGDAYIRSIMFRDEQGNSTVIKFTNIKPFTTLSAKEKKYFEF